MFVRAVRQGLLIAAGSLLAIPAVASADRTVLVTLRASDTVAAFKAAPDGNLTAVPGSPFTTGDDPHAVAITPDGRFAYVVDLVSDGVSTFAIAADGVLTRVGGSIPTGGDLPTGAAVTPDGTHLLVTNRDANDNTDPSVSVFSLNPSTGAPTLVGTPVDPGLYDPRGVAVTPDGKFAIVIGQGLPPGDSIGRVAVLNIGANGTLTPVAGSPLTLTGVVGAFGVTITPDGNRVLVAAASSNKLMVLNLNKSTGALAQVPGSPFNAPGPIVLSVDPSGKRVYSADPFPTEVNGYDIAPATGALAAIPGGTADFGMFQQPDGIALTPDGKFLYSSVNAMPSNLRGLAIGSTGTLTNIAGSPFALPGDFANFFATAVAPTQTPAPSFDAVAGKPKAVTTFDGSATAVRGGFATRFDWEFGDGVAASTTGPSTTHAYGKAGTYAAKLTVSNDCDPAAPMVDGRVFIGQATFCNGSRTASVTRQVTVKAAVAPPLMLKILSRRAGVRLQPRPGKPRLKVGIAKITLRCTVPGGGRCKGVVGLRRGRAPKFRKAGVGSFNVRSGRKVTVRVRVNRATRGVLVQKSKLKTRAFVKAQRGSGGPLTRATAPIRLRTIR